MKWSIIHKQPDLKGTTKILGHSCHVGARYNFDTSALLQKSPQNSVPSPSDLQRFQQVVKMGHKLS